MVEKIKRDVRITRIYEGTSEIMEMTISRDRWQEHLKTRGRYYHDAAAVLESLHKEHPAVGANIAALANHALAEVIERTRVARLTRHQHVQLRLGELIALAEGSASLARRAARAEEGGLHIKADTRLSPAALAATSRVFARIAASSIGEGGVTWIVGAGGVGDDGVEGVESKLGLRAIHQAQAGLVADMDQVRAALYA